MWVFTTDGFFSAVEDRNDPDRIVVRTRAKEDADLLAAWMLGYGVAEYGVTHTPKRDYAYRLFVPRRAWAAYLHESADRINYPNFKDAVFKRQGRKRHDIYLGVWAEMLDLQEDEA